MTKKSTIDPELRLSSEDPTVRTIEENVAELIDRYVRLAVQYRGKFLVNIAEMENILSEIIGIHFIPNNEDKRNSFISLMLYESGLQLHSKIKIFLKIMKLNHPHFIKQFPNLEKDFKKIREFRNFLTHSRLDVDDEYIKEHSPLRFETYKNGKKDIVVINQATINKRLQMSADIIKILFLIRGKIKTKKRQ